MLAKTNIFFKAILALTIAVLFMTGFFVFEKKDVQAQSDAIAVRVIANPQHYSPLAWYKSKGFTGNPTPLVVDGYQAIQDGRTVYVNVANVAYACIATKQSCASTIDCKAKCPSSFGGLPFIGNSYSSTVYTNIYLISYNQNAGADTVTIFNKILSNWKFNTNLTDPGVCFVPQTSPKSCTDDTQCPKSLSCVSGVCQQSCLADSDCGAGSFCNSLKAEVTRDIRRLGDINDLKSTIDAYNTRVGHYPLLSSGTYLPGKSISTWPSWNGEFAAEIGSAPPVDPINKLGDCGGSQYDTKTCWDDKNKNFAAGYSIPDNLPANSRTYIYSTTDEKGRNFTACAEMESGLSIDAQGACRGSFSTVPLPVITCGSLVGVQNQPFTGYVTVADAQNNPTDFHLENLPSGFTSKVTSDPHKIEIDAASAASGGTFDVVYNSASGQATQQCQINISSNAFIVYPVADQKVLVGQPLNFTVYAGSSKKDYAGLNFTFSGVDGISCKNISVTADGRAKCDATLLRDSPFPNAPITVSATNNAHDTFSSQVFDLNVYNNPPVMQPINCDKTVRINNNYKSCKITAISPDKQLIASYNIKDGSLPPGISLIQADGSLAGTPTATGTFSVDFTASDSHGGVSNPLNFKIQVNTYCGDGKKQSPNMEGKGGPASDGFESCDGLSGTPTPFQSSASWQYGCTANCSALKDGYCGDGIVEDGKYDSYASTGGVDSKGIKHGKVDYKEQCDDGNNIDGDGCNTFSAHCQHICGDGSIDTPDSNSKVIPGSQDIMEQCDFGVAKDCCPIGSGAGACLWTAVPFKTWYPASDMTWLPTPPSSLTGILTSFSDGVLPINNIPANRGVGNLSFKATPAIDQSDLSGYPIAIVVATDISNPPDANPITGTIANMKKGILNMVDEFSAWSLLKNEDVYLGALGFGNGVVDPATGINDCANHVCFPVQPADLLIRPNQVNNVQLSALKNNISKYTQENDGLDHYQSFLDLAIPAAQTMLNPYPSAARYLIILTDGCTCGWDSQVTAAASAAKAAGIKVYTVSFDSESPGRWSGPTQLCGWSSDKGVSCNSGNYSYSDAGVGGKNMTSILTSIEQDIISQIPQNFSMQATVAGGSPVTSATFGILPGNFKDVSLNLNSIFGCSLSGNGCTGKTINLNSIFSGNGNVTVSNISLELMPTCQP
ncbi:MAG: putative Ig domain-containing protein [Patescibacteria group bacterium]|nr:putative Ig domain-containing protein [Patescibacteria group bacterium]